MLQLNCTNFYRVFKDTWGLALSQCKTPSFRLANSRCFSSFLLSIVLTYANSTFNIECFPNFTRYTTAPSRLQDQILVWLRIAHCFLHTAVNNSFVIVSDCSLKKNESLLLRFKSIIDRNAVHYLFFSLNREVPKYRIDSYI